MQGWGRPILRRTCNPSNPTITGLCSPIILHRRHCLLCCHSTIARIVYMYIMQRTAHEPSASWIGSRAASPHISSAQNTAVHTNCHWQVTKLIMRTYSVLWRRLTQTRQGYARVAPAHLSPRALGSAIRPILPFPSYCTHHLD